MNYEARVHNVKQVETAKEAANLIKTGQANCHEALKWESQNGTFFAVADQKWDFGETAIIKQEENKFFQVESITAAWIKTAIELAKYFVSAETTTMFKKETQLILNKLIGAEKAWFTCGCCGNDFEGNVKYQIEFDQDAGYGICKSCEY